MNLGDGRTYCLPDGYEVIDSSLRDIQSMLDPSFSPSSILTLDSIPVYARGVDGSDYMPGLIGLNNIKNTDFVNVAVQSLARVPPLRDFFLLPKNYAHSKSALVAEFGALVRKVPLLGWVWSPHNFKGQVSPHELLQAIMHASGNRFKIGQQADPMDLMAWLLNALHTALGGTKKQGSSIIHKTFQGTVKVITHKAEGEEVEETETPFLYLTVDVPPAPLFKDALERNIIPQVPLIACLTKFDGQSCQEMMNGDRRRYIITRLPRYLIVHIKRFSKNTQQFSEKNPTIVNFPVRNLEMGQFTQVSAESSCEPPPISHHDGTPESGSYRVFVHFKANDQWYEVQDLHVNGVHPQLISVSESYIQFYEAAT
ncbi:MAG: hypothetical protein SGPRY_005605 [Prymnesium sp.]